MQKQIVPVILCLFLSSLSFALGSDIESTFSPKLRKYLANNPAALKTLTNSLSEAFVGKTVRLYYFYTQDESEPKAFHTYPDKSVVWIGVRENQNACDEFITILFEVINSKSEARFRKLFQDAQARSVSKAEFAKQVLRVEFEAMKGTRDVLRTLNLSEKERADSYYYKPFAQCPDSFEDFLAYSKKISPKRDALKEYESKYDSLRQNP